VAVVGRTGDINLLDARTLAHTGRLAASSGAGARTNRATAIVVAPDGRTRFGHRPPA
jgi:hypothetical protein